MKWCERCGGPCRPLKYQMHPVDGHNGCRVCALEDLARWGAMDKHLITDRPAVTEPCPHTSGWWLPEGCRALGPLETSWYLNDDATCLDRWLAIADDDR